MPTTPANDDQPIAYTLGVNNLIHSMSDKLDTVIRNQEEMKGSVNGFKKETNTRITALEKWQVWVNASGATLALIVGYELKAYELLAKIFKVSP